VLVDRGLPGSAVAALVLLLALQGCGTDAAKNGSSAQALEQQVTTVPGQPSLRRPTGLERKLLPPDAVIGADNDANAAMLVFSTHEAPARLLDWFRATANGADFVLETEMQEGAEHVFSGRARASGEAFTVRIAPGASGGTTGMIMVTAR
jgi:hypothetical protein